MNLRNAYRILKAAVMDFIDDNAMTSGAALAFYSALSMAPLVLILLAITALLRPDVQKQVIQQAETTVGSQAGGAIDQIVQQGSQHKTAGTVSAIVGFIVLVFSATGAFAQMQYSLNMIWEVQPKPAVVCGSGCGNASFPWA